jgi:SPP1 family predicted phage head-tail adaptor
MRIADLNLRITFQKMSVVTDKYGNHTNAYKDYFSCYATASGSGNEASEAGVTTPKETIDFTVRWYKALDTVTSDSFRIKAGNKILQHPLRKPDGKPQEVHEIPL